MEPMPNDSVQPDPGKREVIYGQATDIGWFSGKHKKRLKLNESKRFAIALFEPNEIKLDDRNKRWVQLSDVGKEAIYADISSLSRRLNISKDKIKELAEADLINGTHRLEDKIQKKMGKLLTLQKFVGCFFNRNAIKDLNENEIKIITNYLEKDEKISKSQELAKEINKNKEISRHFKKRDIRKFKGLAKEINNNKEISKKIENILVALATKLSHGDHDSYQNILENLKDFSKEKLNNAFQMIAVLSNDDKEIKQLLGSLLSLIEKNELSLNSIKERMNGRLLDAFFKKLPEKDIAFYKNIEQPLPEKAKNPEKINQKSRVWCDTMLIRSADDNILRVKLLNDPNVETRIIFDIITDGCLYYERPEITDDYVPYTRDDKTWIRLNIQDLSSRLSLSVEDIRARGGLNLLVKERLDSLLAMQERFSDVIAGIRNGNSKEELVNFCNEIKNLEGSDSIFQLATDLYRNLNNADVNAYSIVINEFAKKNFWWTPRIRLTKETISPFKFRGLAITKALPVVPYDDGFKPSEGKEAVRLNLLEAENNPFAIETDGYIYHQKPISTETHVACKIMENVWVLLNVNSLINRTFLYPPEVKNLALRDNENGNSNLLNELIFHKIVDLSQEQSKIRSIIKKSITIDQEFMAKGEKIIELWTDKIDGMEYEKFLKLLADDVKSLSIYKENKFFKDRADQLLRSLKAVSTRSSLKAILGEFRQLVQPTL